MVSRRVNESDLTALISHETIQPYIFCKSLLCGLSGLFSAGLWRQLRLLLHIFRHTIVLSCSLSNSILSVVVLKCSPINIIFRSTAALPPFHSSSSLLSSLRILLRFFFSLSPPSLPHAPYAENYAVVVVGVNRNRIRGGSQKKEIGGGKNELPQEKAPPEPE